MHWYAKKLGYGEELIRLKINYGKEGIRWCEMWLDPFSLI